jgi:two-component system, LuxR family, response regulator TtrR
MSDVSTALNPIANNQTSTSKNAVFIIDDDEAVRDSLRWLLDANGFSTFAYPSAESFLTDYTPDLAGCVVADVRMPGMSGSELQEEIKRRGWPVPIILITGHGDVPMAVASIKKGAYDFIEKPFNDEAICSIVRAALASTTNPLLAKLTGRETQVLDRIVAGRLNKQIADDLSISIKTVEAHRANIMEKVGAKSMADLMKVALNKT